MADMLVKLFSIPMPVDEEEKLLENGIRIKRALAPGPMAVSEKYRKQGVGKVLLLKALYSMSEMGYAYAIIGWPTKRAIPFYEKCVDAIMIEDDSLGIYKRMIEID